jgi:hypothetical protein
MLPVFALAMARDAVARQFDYDDAGSALASDVAPAARPRRRRSASGLRARLGNVLAGPSWSPSH